jgi:cytochrome c
MHACLAVSLGLTAIGLDGCSQPRATGNSSPPQAPSPPATAEQQAILATLPAPYRYADLYDGQAKFAACKVCHTVARGAGAAYGPNLWGVFGRRSGTAPGFAYSNGLTRLDVTWTPQTLDAWIANPRAIVPGTRMAYAGLESRRGRVDVVAYLKTVTTPAPQTTDAAGR